MADRPIWSNIRQELSAKARFPLACPSVVTSSIEYRSIAANRSIFRSISCYRPTIHRLIMFTMIETFTYRDVLPTGLLNRYTFMETGSAAKIADAVCSDAFAEVIGVLERFTLTSQLLLTKGGSRGQAVLDRRDGSGRNVYGRGKCARICRPNARNDRGDRVGRDFRRSGKCTRICRPNT